jgi:chemotaxis protein MotB
MPNNTTPIVIKKKVVHGGHHGGAWKVAYADFVTAMMSLFIVLWLLASSEQVKKAVASYFIDPTSKNKNMGTGLVGSGESLSLSKTDLEKLQKKIEEALRKKIPDFQKLKNQVTISMSGEGLRIELLETQKGIFFDSGNAKPTEAAQEILKILSAELGKLPNHLLIEGHTDAKPFAGGQTGYSNWELSSDRANAARRLMMANGVRADQIRQVRGFADQQLRNGKDPDDPGNRRVSVIVQYQDAATLTQAQSDLALKSVKDAATPPKEPAKGEAGKAGEAGKGALVKAGEAKPAEGKSLEQKAAPALPEAARATAGKPSPAGPPSGTPPKK